MKFEISEGNFKFLKIRKIGVFGEVNYTTANKPRASYDRTSAVFN